MRLYILGASAWLVIGVRFAFDALRSVNQRSKKSDAVANLADSLPRASLALDPDLDPRIARIIEEIPRRRVRRFA